MKKELLITIAITLALCIIAILSIAFQRGWGKPSANTMDEPGNMQTTPESKTDSSVNGGSGDASADPSDDTPAAVSPSASGMPAAPSAGVKNSAGDSSVPDHPTDSDSVLTEEEKQDRINSILKEIESLKE